MEGHSFLAVRDMFYTDSDSVSVLSIMKLPMTVLVINVGVTLKALIVSVTQIKLLSQ